MAKRPVRTSGRGRNGSRYRFPALVSEETFALAAERLVDKERFAPHRTIEPSIVQGLVSCSKCGYALSHLDRQFGARFTAWVRMAGATSAARCATAGRSAKTYSTRSCCRR